MQAEPEPVLTSADCVSAFVTRALDQTQLSGLAEMLRFIAERCGAYACVLWRVAPGADLSVEALDARLFVLAQWLRDKRFWTSHRHTLESATGEAILSATPVNVTENQAMVGNPLWTGLDVTSFCSVPVVFLDGEVGAVNVYLTDRSPLRQDEIERLHELAALIPKLYQTIRDKVGSTLASRINAIIHAEENSRNSHSSFEHMQVVTQRICEAIAAEFHAAEVSVFFEDKFIALGKYDLLASTWKVEFQKSTYRLGEPSLTSWILGKALPVNILDLTDFRDEREKRRIQNKYPDLEWSDSLDFQGKLEVFFPRAGDKALRPLSFMGAPVKSGNSVMGAVRCCAALESPYYFGAGEVRLLELAAAQLAQYWINWIAARESQEENQAWRMLIGRVRDLNNGVQNDVVAGELNEERVFGDALGIVQSVIRGAETFSIRLLDESRRQLYYGPVRGRRWHEGSPEECRSRLQQRFPIDGASASIGAEVVKTGTPYVMAGPDPLYNGPFGDTTAMIVVPLRSNDKVVGVIDIRTSGENRFPTYAVSIAELLGQQLGLYQDLSTAMQRAQLESKAMLRKQTETFEDLGHQLKSPVFQAQARLQAVLRTRTIDDDLRLQLNAVRGLTRKINRVSTSIRLFAQILDKKMVPLQPVLLNPDELQRTLFEYAIDHKLSAERPVNFTIRPEGFGVLRTNQVRVDQDLLEQVVNNVLDNAFKYSFARTNIRVQVGALLNRFFIAVINEGIRLRPADVDKAKERGWRSEDAESSTGEGSGIGLWIADQIMKTLGGEIENRSDHSRSSNGGTLIFPDIKINDALVIFSVEDDSMQAEWIRNALESSVAKAQVRRISTEHEFISRFEEIASELPNVILLDAMLRWTDPSPDMPERPVEVRQGGIAQAGLRCQKRLSGDARTENIPVILYTVLQKNSLESLNMEVPKGTTLVQKNADPRELIAAVKHILALGRQD